MPYFPTENKFDERRQRRVSIIVTLFRNNQLIRLLKIILALVFDGEGILFSTCYIYYIYTEYNTISNFPTCYIIFQHLEYQNRNDDSK